MTFTQKAIDSLNSLRFQEHLQTIKDLNDVGHKNVDDLFTMFAIVVAIVGLIVPVVFVILELIRRKDYKDFKENLENDIEDRVKNAVKEIEKENKKELDEFKNRIITLEAKGHIMVGHLNHMNIRVHKEKLELFSVFDFTFHSVYFYTFGKTSGLPNILVDALEELASLKGKMNSILINDYKKNDNKETLDNIESNLFLLKAEVEFYTAEAAVKMFGKFFELTEDLIKILRESEDI